MAHWPISDGYMPKMPIKNKKLAYDLYKAIIKFGSFLFSQLNKYLLLGGSSTSRGYNRYQHDRSENQAGRRQTLILGSPFFIIPHLVFNLIIPFFTRLLLGSPPSFHTWFSTYHSFFFSRFLCKVLHSLPHSYIRFSFIIPHLVSNLSFHI